MNCFKELSALYGDIAAGDVDVVGETDVAVAVVIALEPKPLVIDFAYKSNRLCSATVEL